MITQTSSILETTIALLDVVTLHHHYKDTDCPTKESETITDLSTPQIEGGSFHVISTNPSYLTHMDFADILSSQCTHQEIKILKILSYHERFQNYDWTTNHYNLWHFETALIQPVLIVNI